MTKHVAMNCRLVRTSREAYAVIRAAHPEMEVFGSYSAPCGRDGDGVGDMRTLWGIPGQDYPTVMFWLTWDLDNSDPVTRHNEEATYWLCCPIGESVISKDLLYEIIYTLDLCRESSQHTRQLSSLIDRLKDLYEEN